MDMDEAICNLKQRQHICRTCDHYLKKKKTPSQAICNEFNIPLVPCKLKNLNISNVC